MIIENATITFPVLFEAKENLSGDLKFSCSLLIPKTNKANIDKIQKEIEKAIAKGKEKYWNNKVPKFNYAPLRDGDKELADGTKEGTEYKGVYFINASANADSRPQVVGPDASPLMDQQAIYSGCVVHADVRPFPYKKGGNSGIGWWLNNIMLVKDGKRLDGKMDAVDAFASYAQDTTVDEGELA
jgi:hypothetical protein